jgi:hypothetical protein
MVKVNAPALSLSASGKLAGAMVFASWKGRPYVRELVIPANPKTGPQKGIRAMMKFLSQDWKNLSAPNKATWDTLAAQTTISPFNAFISYNMARWRRFLGPSKVDPATEASTGLTVSAITAVGAIHQMTVTVTPSAGTNIWGMAIFRSPTGTFDGVFSNCIAVIIANGASAVAYVDTPLVAGTYYYSAKIINIDGKFGTESAEATGTVT